jgi:hypothetical protein
MDVTLPVLTHNDSVVGQARSLFKCDRCSLTFTLRGKLKYVSLVLLTVVKLTVCSQVVTTKLILYRTAVSSAAKLSHEKMI